MADKEVADSSDSMACLPSSSTSMEPCTSANAATGNDNVSTSDNCDTDLLTEAVQCMQQGKRHMIVKDYHSATVCFEQACRILDSCYGVNADECGEAYLYYGIALLEEARFDEGLANGVVKIKENENEDDDSEEDEEEEKKDGNDDDEEEEEEAEDKPKTENNDDNEAEAAIPSAGTSNETSEIDITQPSTSKGEYASAGGDEKSEEDEDTISNFEISWDLLTSAEKVFARNLHSKENRLHLAEALQKRAEISIEWENNDEAIQLLNECIDHRKSALPADHRLIAEAYHYLGVAYSFKFDYENSNLCFESAIDIIQLRLDNLVKMNTAHMDEFEKTSHEKEIEQLRSLIPDLRGKMDDLKEQMQSQYKTLQTLEKECEEEETKKLQMNKSKPVNNISHLIKRKREENEAENGDTVKKACVDGNASSSSAAESSTSESK